jgi:hypothetical protein
VLHCPYGVERSVDSDDCEICRCHDPCKDYSCPDETRCAVDLYRNSQTGETEFRGVCRPSKLTIHVESVVGCICFIFRSYYDHLSLLTVLTINVIISAGTVSDNWP